MRLLFIAVLISAPAFAQVYSWEDRSGLHYTTDARAVPRGARVTMLAKVGRADAAHARPPTERAAPPPVAPASPTNPSVEREWRDQFIQLHRAIATKHQELSALEVSLPNKVDCVAQPLIALPEVPQATTTAPLPFANTRCMPNAMYDRIKLKLEQKRVEVSDAENDLVQLDRRASLEGVPREWRRGW